MSLSSVEKYFAGISPAVAHTHTHTHEQKKNRDFSIVHHLSLLLFMFILKVYEKVFESIEMLKANKNNRLVRFFSQMFVVCVVIYMGKMCL